MHQPFPFDDDDEDLSPDAGFALRHALRRALAREIQARRIHARVAEIQNARRTGDPTTDEIAVAAYPRAVRQVA